MFNVSVHVFDQLQAPSLYVSCYWNTLIWVHINIKYVIINNMSNILRYKIVFSCRLKYTILFPSTVGSFHLLAFTVCLQALLILLTYDVMFVFYCLTFVFSRLAERAVVIQLLFYLLYFYSPFSSGYLVLWNNTLLNIHTFKCYIK